MSRAQHRRIRRYAQSGMTLLEVIVAMSVLTIGIAGALGAVSSCIVTSKAAESYSYAAILAQQVAGELERSATERGELSGTFDDASTGYSWEAVLEETETEGLLSAEITVSWQTGAREQQYRLMTCIRPQAQQQETTSGQLPTTPQMPGGPR